MLAVYVRLDLLLIDEFGFDRLEREAQAQASTVYYRLLDARTGRRSTAVATNIDFKAWADYLGDPPLATAFLDRLVDGRDPEAHWSFLSCPSGSARHRGRYRRLNLIDRVARSFRSGLPPPAIMAQRSHLLPPAR